MNMPIFDILLPSKMKHISFSILLIMLTASFLLIGCTGDSTNLPIDPSKSTITVTSDAFNNGEAIPVKYTCDGINVSPQIAWTPGPEGTEFYVLLLDDFDAPSKVFSHWILYNIPKGVTDLHDGISTNGILDTGAIQGRNDMTKLGYYGPCPGDGKLHNYVFTIFAVDTYFQMPAGWRQDVIDAMKGHVLAQGQLTGTYQR
jgi:Raf kinase inhibitor-like YbhB/YbcL family protein